MEAHYQMHLGVVSSRIFNEIWDEKHDYDEDLELVRAKFKLDGCEHFKNTIEQMTFPNQ